MGSSERFQGAREPLEGGALPRGTGSLWGPRLASQPHPGSLQAGRTAAAAPGTPGGSSPPSQLGHSLLAGPQPAAGSPPAPPSATRSPGASRRACAHWPLFSASSAPTCRQRQQHLPGGGGAGAASQRPAPPCQTAPTQPRARRARVPQITYSPPMWLQGCSASPRATSTRGPLPPISPRHTDHTQGHVISHPGNFGSLPGTHPSMEGPHLVQESLPHRRNPLQLQARAPPSGTRAPCPGQVPLHCLPRPPPSTPGPSPLGRSPQA